MRTMFLKESFIERRTPRAPGHSAKVAVIARMTGKHLWQSPARLKAQHYLKSNRFTHALLGLLERSPDERLDDPLGYVFFSLFA